MKNGDNKSIVIPKEIFQSVKVGIQVTLLTVGYSIGYGAGAGSRCLSAIVSNSPKLGFMKEIAKEVNKGYDAGVTEKEPASVTVTT